MLYSFVIFLGRIKETWISMKTATRKKNDRGMIGEIPHNASLFNKNLDIFAIAGLLAKAGLFVCDFRVGPLKSNQMNKWRYSYNMAMGSLWMLYCATLSFRGIL